MKAIDILMNANKGKIPYVRFEIPAGEKIIDAILHAPDLLTIQREQRTEYRIRLAELKQERPETLAMPIDEQTWKEKISQIKSKDAKKAVEGNKPKNLAEQIAEEDSFLIAIQKLLPKYLKGTDGKLLFPTAEERQKFNMIISANIDLFSLISNKYIELINQMFKVEETAKNLSDKAN